MRKLWRAGLPVLVVLLSAIFGVLVTYGLWYLASWDDMRSPEAQCGNAAIYALLALEVFVGLPVGMVGGGIIAAFLVKRQRAAAAV